MLRTTRSISLLRPTVTSVVPTQAELTSSNVDSLFSDEVTDTTRVRVLGQPPTLASLVVPPSIALYVRKGCLTSLHGSPSINMSYEWIGFWSNLLRYGTLKPAIYHKLISTTKFDALVAPNFLSNRLGPRLGLSSSPFRTLCLLNLDGTSDWNVWGKNSIVAFEGNTSLELRPPRLNLFRNPLFSSKYLVLKGRGNVLLSGSGSVYTIQLKDASDEIILRSEHLLALNGSTQLDINESITEQSLIPQEEVKKVVEPFREFDIKMFFQISRDLIATLWNRSKSIYSYLKNGPTKFLKIKGPRTLLVQSSFNVYLPASNVNPGVTTAAKLTTQPSKDYLNYVSVSNNGQVDFQSTADFQQSVDRIKSLVKK
ncbi:Aim24p TDEL_0C03100 [Torulaspora delbrueckii]|uniref:Altered inheritance of mitochondria protein 24, mitochondrial n=1 Tax=Torulaspora delbrueckii TaxID=4950 RepID=G8ZRQ7_TORDE|nr:hypothetical protein TDEL_0C03100 [Torulaspora delbrueckii]CCE91199.1 hypothetical protein TDEL_0C03100 [Torulaspora delbrueckii]